MTSKKRVFVAVSSLLSLPLVLAFAEAASFNVQNRNNGSIVSSGKKREYLLYVPKSYDSTRPAPLVISMHGGGGWPAQQRDISRWNQMADRHGFIVVYPSGLDDGGMRGWSAVHRGAGLTEDVRFISDLIDDLEKAYRIDPTRIYANGLSNGGGMAFVLSCALSRRIAAVGMVASAQFLPQDWCTDQRPMPMISFHGTADSITPYKGGTSWVAPDQLADVSEWTATWARRNGCGPEPIESVVAADVTRREYTGCGGDAKVVLFTIHGGGHTWPGGELLPEWFLGRTSNSVDATKEMWAFFQEHPLRELPAETIWRTVLEESHMRAK